EDTRYALPEGLESERDERLGDSFQRLRDERRMRAQVGVQAIARQLPRQRQRREQRRNDGRIADPAIEAEPDDRLELLGVAGRRCGIEHADLPPVLRRADRAARARPVPILEHSVGLDASPGLDGIAAARRDLQEVRTVALVKSECRLGEPGGRAIDARKVSPHGVGHAVDGLAADGRHDTLAPAHLLHPRMTPSASTRSPCASTASNAITAPARPRPRTTKLDGIGTMPVKRTAISVTRTAS